MKKFFIAFFLLLSANALFAQDNGLPQLAVVEFSVNNTMEKTRQDAVTVRNIVESQMVATGKYQVISHTDIDKLLENQRIQVSAISNAENIKKLQLQNISYIVTGSVDAMGSDYVVTVKILDVSTGRFTHSANDFMGGGSREFYAEVNALVGTFVSGMVSSGGQVAQAAGSGARTASAPDGFVRVDGGTFQMGGANGDDDEKPVHTVTVSGFYMGKYEVTQKEWREIMGTTVRQQRDMADKSLSLFGEGDAYPMYYVSWYEAVEYCNKRSVLEGLTPAYRGSGDSIACDFSATGYRLPTEAEWEYAAKGGNKDPMTYEYAGGNSVGAVAWYSGNSGSTAHPVGRKVPNSLGLYDMSGNVWEWCWDWYKSDYYSSGARTDPRGASSGTSRVWRGGSWLYGA